MSRERSIMDYSVLLTVYKSDNPDFFRLSLESMLKQTVPSNDIVIVKDGPVPNTIQGVECEIIDYRCDSLDKREIQFNKTNNNLLYNILRSIMLKPKHNKKIVMCQKFLESENMCSEKIYNRSTISQVMNKYLLAIIACEMDLNSFRSPITRLP